MSGEGPESIPTSADPRSKRPTKKRALTPTSAQAASLDALFAKPDQEIRIPDSSAVAKRQLRGAAPEIVTNVQGSSAGAGSGEFHVYKAARRREYERLRAMDEEVKTERATEEFERERAEKAAKDDERTRKNREKREKKKNRAKKGPPSKPTPAPAASITKRDISKPNDDKEPPSPNVAESRAGAGVEGKEAVGDAPAGLIIHDDDDQAA